MKIPRILLHFCVLDFTVSVCLLALFPLHNTLITLIATLLHPLNGDDSTHFLGLAWQTVASGQPLYQTLFFAQHQKFLYPTSSLLLCDICAALHLSRDLVVHLLVWLSLGGTLWSSGELVLETLARQGAPAAPAQRTPVRIAAALIALLFFPLVEGVRVGQIQVVLTFLWMLAVLCILRRAPIRAGFCLALICAFKPMLAIFLLWAILRRQWRFLVAFLAALTLIQLAAIAAFGWHNEISYLAVLSFLSHHPEAFVHNQTVGGFVQRWLHNGDMANWSYTAYPPYSPIAYYGTLAWSALLLGFGLFFPILRHWKDLTLDFLVFGIISVLTSPIAWEHHYAYFLPAGLYLLATRAAAGREKLPALLTLTLLTLGNAFPFYALLANTRWNPLLSLDLFAGIVMLLIATFHFVRPPPKTET